MSSQADRHAVVRHMIDSVNDEGFGLTEWEVGFMESLTDQFDGSGRCTDAQYEVLEKIYDKRVY